jgi:hypothetical protein
MRRVVTIRPTLGHIFLIEDSYDIVLVALNNRPQQCAIRPATITTSTGSNHELSFTLKTFPVGHDISDAHLPDQSTRQRTTPILFGT